jgi:hypothetical protein
MKLFVLISMFLTSVAFANTGVPLSVAVTGTYTVEGVAHQFTGNQLVLKKATTTEAKYEGKILVDATTTEPFVSKITLDLATNDGKSTATFSMMNDSDMFNFTLDMSDLIPVSGKELKGAVSRMSPSCTSPDGCVQIETDGTSTLVVNY